MNFVCVASGPSLCSEDLFLVCKSDSYIISVNRSFELFHENGLEYDYTYAADLKWWNKFGKLVNPNVAKYTLDNVAEVLHKRKIDEEVIGVPWYAEPTLVEPNAIYHGGNSGQHAIDLARILGATKIVLVGYDFKYGVQQERHFHEDYPAKWKNADNPEIWRETIKVTANQISNHYGIDLVNCSRDTAIDCIRRSSLEKELVF